MEDKREFKSGTVSTKQVRLSLLPHRGLINTAKRFEVGLEKHREKAWNNLSSNQSALEDSEWLIERCSHAIEHLYSLIDYLTHKTTNKDTALGDAGAVGWCGLVLGEALSVEDYTETQPNAVYESHNLYKCQHCGMYLRAGQSTTLLCTGNQHDFAIVRE